MKCRCAPTIPNANQLSLLLDHSHAIVTHHITEQVSTVDLMESR